MNQVKLKRLIKERKIVIPLYFLRMLKEFNLNIDEFIVLLYLFNQDNATFNPTLIAEDLRYDMLKVMEIISCLEDKGLLRIQTMKNDQGIMEEILDMSLLFDKISLSLIKELNEKDESNLNIHNLIEQEFNRKLTPLEHEMIDDWQNNDYDKELIKEAVKEASINGVSNLRYIDKILIEWAKKGYKVPSDIKKINNDEKENVEVYNFNCDWLDDDEEI